tara:strand:+ start:1962 stop:4097 length:2136 start_codon:yes stop_codon:yes gene_type:complete
MSVFDRILFNANPRSVVREGEFQGLNNIDLINKIDFLNALDPNSVTRESELAKQFNLFKLNNPDSTIREGEFQGFNNMDPRSVVREGEFDFDPSSVLREGEGLQYDVEVDGKPEQFSFDNMLTKDGMNVLRENEGITPLPILKEGEETVIVIDRREGSKTFGMPIGVPRNMETYKLIRSGELDEITREIMDRAEGSPMEGEMNAVGIADGLDQETPTSDPMSDGIAKVSPEQYVQLMNEIRGDEVPMEGRVQELAMTVGEKDAQDTPLSVLALVQPVFELQEQEGIGATQQAQNVMPTASAQLNQPMNDGILRANTGIFVDGTTVNPVLMNSLLDMYGADKNPINISERSEEITDMYLDKANLQDKALLAAAPGLLKTGMTILDPEAGVEDIATQVATEVASLGTNISAMRDPYVKAGITQALQEETDRKKLFYDVKAKIGDEAVKQIFTKEKFITDSYTGFTVGEISGVPKPDQREAYFNKIALLDMENANEKAKLTAVNNLLTLPDLTTEDKAQIRLDPGEWLKTNQTKAQGLSEKDKNTQENSLRSEYAKVNKNFIVQADSFTKIKTAAKVPSPAGDLSLIFNFMKMLDPQSTVRESEFQNAANAAPLLTRLGIDFDKISTVWEGRILTDPQRKDFLTKTLALYEAGLQQNKAFTNEFTRLAELYEVRPEAVIVDYTIKDYKEGYDFDQGFGEIEGGTEDYEPDAFTN